MVHLCHAPSPELFTMIMKAMVMPAQHIERKQALLRR